MATNNGWRPHSDQIGLTGNRIAPNLYIACGISGAIQHLVGCKGAKHVMVINKDNGAPSSGGPIMVWWEICTKFFLP